MALWYEVLFKSRVFLRNQARASDSVFIYLPLVAGHFPAGSYIPNSRQLFYAKTMMPDVAPRILLVDDEPTVLDILRLTLEQNGFVCCTATNGLEALRNLHHRLPNIIISDLRMPGMSGFELLAIIRLDFPSIPVIVVSGEPVENARALGLPMNAYLQKGAYTSEELIATIRQMSDCFTSYSS